MRVLPAIAVLLSVTLCHACLLMCVWECSILETRSFRHDWSFFYFSTHNAMLEGSPGYADP